MFLRKIERVQSHILVFLINATMRDRENQAFSWNQHLQLKLLQLETKWKCLSHFNSHDSEKFHFFRDLVQFLLLVPSTLLCYLKSYHPLRINNIGCKNIADCYIMQNINAFSKYLLYVEHRKLYHRQIATLFTRFYMLSSLWATTTILL